MTHAGWGRLTGRCALRRRVCACVCPRTDAPPPPPRSHYGARTTRLMRQPHRQQKVPPLSFLSFSSFSPPVFFLSVGAASLSLGASALNGEESCARGWLLEQRAGARGRGKRRKSRRALVRARKRGDERARAKPKQLRRRGPRDEAAAVAPIARRLRVTSLRFACELLGEGGTSWRRC